VETEGINNPSKDSQQSLYSQSFLPDPDRLYGWGFLFFEVFIRKNTMYIKKLSPQEALETIKLRMNYDSSKTLNENKLIVLEQKANLTTNQQAALTQGFGPVTAKAADDLAKQGKLKTNTLKSVFGGTQTPTSAVDTSTANKQTSDTGVGKAIQQGVQAANLKIDVSCIGFNGEEYKEITTALVSSDGIGKPVHVWRFWPDGKAIYVESGDKYKYTYKCSKTKPGVVEITDVDSSEVDEYKLFDKKNSQTVAPKKAVPIPSELKDIEGVKKFQDWLDKNHEGWHDKYKVLNGSVPKGYGKFGPRTNKWWKLQRVNYLNSSPTTNTTTSSKVDTTQSQSSTKIDTTPPKAQIPSASKGFQKFAQSQFGANSQPSNSETTTKPTTRVASADTEF